jgi:hypothetical protein
MTSLERDRQREVDVTTRRRQGTWPSPKSPARAKTSAPDPGNDMTTWRQDLTTEARVGDQDPLHRTRESLRERVRRVLQRQALRRAPRPRDLLHAGGGTGPYGVVAAGVQPRPAVQCARLPAAGSRGHRPAAAAGQPHCPSRAARSSRGTGTTTGRRPFGLRRLLPVSAVSSDAHSRLRGADGFSSSWIFGP